MTQIRAAAALRAWFARPAVSLLTGLGVVILGYYAVPMEGSELSSVVRLLLTVAALGALGWLVRHEVRRFRTAPVASLVMVMEVVVVLFAAAQLAVERWLPGQFSGLVTRTDALYFTVTTMSTVGYGDIHADGQVARAMVVAMMTFDVVFVATLGAAVSQRYGSIFGADRER